MQEKSAHFTLPCRTLAPKTRSALLIWPSHQMDQLSANKNSFLMPWYLDSQERPEICGCSAGSSNSSSLLIKLPKKCWHAQLMQTIHALLNTLESPCNVWHLPSVQNLLRLEPWDLRRFWSKVRHRKPLLETSKNLFSQKFLGALI